MSQTSIEMLVKDVSVTFKDAGYTKRSVEVKQSIWNAIVRLHLQNGLDQYDQGIVDLFIKEASLKFQAQSIGKIYYLQILKSANYLADFNEHGWCEMGTRNIDNGLNDYYQSILEKIRCNPEWNPKGRKAIRQSSMPFLKWLQQHAIPSFEQMSDATIRQYFIESGEKMNFNSMDTVRRNLRKLFGYLYLAHITDSDYQTVLSFPIPSEFKIKRPASQEETAKVLCEIDRSSVKGKRDFAIILLAVVLGLRGVDIAELTFDEIDWLNGEFHIVQSKTEKILALPITKDVGMALQDYLLNGRNLCDDPHVFLTMKSPYKGIGRTTPYQVFNGYRKKLGLPKAPFHGLRRGVATGMVTDGVPVTTVAQVLGHSSIEPTKKYISLDSTHLQECALNLQGLSQLKEGDCQ